MPLAADFKMAKDTTGAKLYLYDTIGPEWAGMIGAKTVRDALAQVKPDAPLHVFINSPGGSVFEGQTIYSMLQRHEGEVTVHVDGAALSAASLIAMAGDTIEIASGGMMMIHPASGVEIGTADQMRATADLLDKLSGAIAAAYAARTKISVAEITAMMNAETWFTSQEAVAKGFADRVVQAKSPVAFAPLAFKPINMPQRFAAHFKESTMPNETNVPVNDIAAEWESNADGCRDRFKYFPAYAAYKRSMAAHAKQPAPPATPEPAAPPATPAAQTRITPSIAKARAMWATMSEKEQRKQGSLDSFAARIAAEKHPGQLTGLRPSRYDAA